MTFFYWRKYSGIASMLLRIRVKRILIEEVNFVQINMGMIASMLRGHELITNISSEDPMVLYGVGFSETPGRACIKSLGNDTVIVSGDSSITMVNCSLIYGFDIVCDIFHMYNKWYDLVLAYCRNAKWQDLIECTQPFYPNPLVLFDSNLKVLAMSSNFPKGSVDDEWDFLLEYRVASSSAVAAGRSRHRFTETLHNGSNVFISQPRFSGDNTFLSISILHTTIPWGYLSSLDTVCRIEKGSIAILSLLSKIIGNTLIENTEASDIINDNNNVFQKCFASPEVDVKSMQNFLEYYSYSETDSFAVVVSSFLGDHIAENLKMMYSALINTINLPIFIIDDTLVTILDVSNIKYSVVSEIIQYLTEKFNAVTAESLTLQNVRNVYYAYNQCKFVLSRVKTGKCGYHFFYNYAVDYLILNSDRNILLNACNQPILNMFRVGDKQLDAVVSFEMYLRNERSLQETSKQLGIHKNTVSYRIQNVLELTKLNIDDRYDREYSLVTFAVLRALGR